MMIRSILDSINYAIIHTSSMMGVFFAGAFVQWAKPTFFPSATNAMIIVILAMAYGVCFLLYKFCIADRLNLKQHKTE